MEQSLLYATHLIFRDLLWKHSIWNIFAYNSRNDALSPKWKVKTKKHIQSKSRFSYGMLKCYCPSKKRATSLTFNFGYGLEREHVVGIKTDVVKLEYEYELERQIVEKICALSDEGCTIIANDETILNPYEGSQLLVKIDLESPSYAHLDVKPPF